MNRYETNSKGLSPALSQIKNETSAMPRSAFDLSRRKSFDAAPFAIIPVEVFPMLPNSDLYITYDVQAITKNPLIRRVLSSMSVELRTYYIKNSDCWEGWNNFITKGRSGKLNLSIPTLSYKHAVIDGFRYETSLPYNPYQYLNIAPPILYNSNQSFEDNSGIKTTNSNSGYDPTGLLGGAGDAYYNGQSALPAVFYNKIAKQYQNPNLLQDNKDWYPENENHDNILPYNATSVTTSSYDHSTVKFGDTVDSVLQDKEQPTNDKHSKPWLNILYYRQRKGNQFNTGSPFPDLIRGDVPLLETFSGFADFTNSILSDSQSLNLALGLNTSSSKIGAGNLFSTLSGDIGIVNLPDHSITLNSSNPVITEGMFSHNHVRSDLSIDSSLGISQNSAKLIEALNKNTIAGLKFNFNQFRKLATLTVFRERMARTDGSYNEMIKAQFNYNPKWHEHDVVYCGGSYQPIVFSEVVQTSESGSTPLGTTAGRAVTSSQNNSISVHSNDYGMVMTVMTIVPDDYYSQGINRIWSNLDQATQYFPIMNNFEPTAILNKELFVSGNDSVDNDVFNYQELFFEYKSRLNEIAGLMALPISEVGDVGAYIFNRLFNSTPQFNNAFVTGKMTDNENLCFSSTEQAQFIFSIASLAKFVAPLPAISQPTDFGLSF